ncbi:MAG TPA: hypothetical protein PLV06_06110 [Bacteroidales bacterium]|nr:hypothetical protein [Bacteroidales bacterium]HPJ58792.1 hypothetical protein [Bacteroidales bacterium]HPR11942.1 hypothetical protein [Bacteroidales bacterium]HRW85766.1 hypothetical protein [Bacteroidales bacterium]
MKVVKHMSGKTSIPGPEEQMRKAIMDLYRDAQFGHHVKVDNSPMMRSARFIGRTAGYMHRVFTSTWFRIILVVAALWLLLHWTGLSVELVRHGEVLVSKPNHGRLGL